MLELHEQHFTCTGSTSLENHVASEGNLFSPGYTMRWQISTKVIARRNIQVSAVLQNELNYLRDTNSDGATHTNFVLHRQLNIF